MFNAYALWLFLESDFYFKHQNKNDDYPENSTAISLNRDTVRTICSSGKETYGDEFISLQIRTELLCRGKCPPKNVNLFQQL